MKVYAEIEKCTADGTKKFLDDWTHNRIVLFAILPPNNEKHRLKVGDIFSQECSGWTLSFAGYVWEYNKTLDRVFIRNREVEI